MDQESEELQYAKEHRIPWLLENMIHHLLTEHPADPVTELLQWLECTESSELLREPEY